MSNQVGDSFKFLRPFHYVQTLHKLHCRQFRYKLKITFGLPYTANISNGGTTLDCSGYNLMVKVQLALHGHLQQLAEEAYCCIYNNQYMCNIGLECYSRVGNEHTPMFIISWKFFQGL